MSEPNYRKLLVWQKAHKNALLTISLLDKCPGKFARIADQCLGAVTSIGANIAEGNGARTKKQKASYFEIALNSSYEFDNWLQVLKDSSILSGQRDKIVRLEKENIEIIKILSKIVASLSS